MLRFLEMKSEDKNHDIRVIRLFYLYLQRWYDNEKKTIFFKISLDLNICKTFIFVTKKKKSTETHVWW